MAGEIFISYRRADEAWAKLLCEQLRAEGVEAWYDAHVGAGEDWRATTARALEKSRIFILLFSANAAESSDIAKELAAAVLEKKLIVPVRLENIAPKGAFLYELASRNWINAYENTEAKLAELARGLARLVRSGVKDESLLPFERAPAVRRRRWPLVAGAAGIALVAAAAIAAWFLWPAPHWTVESSRPFIATLALEGEPAFSPDGRMLAYTSGPDPLSRKIYVRNVAGGDAIRITSDGYDDVSPTWSPDGTRIAYVAQKTGEPCRIMVAAVPAGLVREAGRCSGTGVTSLAWRPGTSSLYYIERFSADRSGTRPDAIFRLDAESGERRPVTRLDGSAAALGSQLLCSPDGKWLFFLRDDSYESESITILELASGRETSLGRVGWAASAAWTPSGAWSQDSRNILVSASSGIGSKLIAYPIDGGKPYDVYTAATNIRHLAAGGGLLALETDPSRQNLARVSAAPAAQPDIIDPASGMTWSPSFAPDGTLAFLSNRSGTNAIWLMKPGAAPAPFFDAGLAVLFLVDFSPDGTRLAAVFARPGGATVRIFDRNGASLGSFDDKMIGSGLPTWTPDSKALVVLDIDNSRDVRVEIADPSRRTPVAPPNWGPVTIRNDGTYAARFDRPGIWQIDKGERLISSKYPDRFLPPAVFRGADVLIPDFGAAGGPRILAQPLSGGPDRVLGYAPGAEGRDSGTESRMAVNPVTGEVIYVASVQGDTNIDLLTVSKH